ncbi:flagellar protein FlgN [Geomicrobium sediminis]|uniref:Flagellar biosynthesis/type III secretory pathway chaperone n=1 Tax=Geomicrobium sediminis TaxID=1347788 RepID=A0ABS2P8F2_9BACL|nr:flagellar protein FlgN [Geomicrobium sediminis]MBM7631281.1 flagellar biosynthesis/type III secretory pathway chaperone [Geomicrobium sediminis]
MSQIHQFVETLEELQQRHHYLLSLAKKKTECLQKADIQGIQDLVKLEAEQMKELRYLERERKSRSEEVVKWYCPKHVQDLPMNEWLEYLPEEEKNVLHSLRTDLKATMEELKDQNELNRQLVTDSLSVVEATLDMLRPEDNSQSYQPPNQVQGNENKQHFSAFDSKA